MSRLQAMLFAGRMTRPGIGVRLIVAFLAVAVLVFAANFFVVQAVLIEKSTTIYQPVPVHDTRPPAGVPSVRAPSRHVDTATLRDAIAHYRVVVRARFESDTDHAETELQAAAEDLGRALDAFS